MDHYSTLDQDPALAVETGLRDMASPSPTASAPAGIATATKRPKRPLTIEAAFGSENSSHSLEEMAERDLEAALQLLADRAQYITGASGAAIALRRGEHNDMLCRASAGANAPQLGALLSMEYGLSGESVRTRQLSRCDDAQRDPRVNREICRELGIASVAVLPILSGDQVLGVFELLSGKPRAFDERDVSALLRLGEMVETAVKQAIAAQITPALPQGPMAAQPEVEVILIGEPDAEPVSAAPNLTPGPAASVSKEFPLKQVAPAKQEETSPAPRKPLFWSAAMRAEGVAPAKEKPETISVPPVLRNLQKCQACGFPVSQGRAFCVECEERQWRGQRLPHPAIAAQNDQTPPTDSRKFTGLADALRSLARDSSSQQVSSKMTEVTRAEVKTPELKTANLETEEPKSVEPKCVEPAPAPLPIAAPACTTRPEQNSIVLATVAAEVTPPPPQPSSAITSEMPAEITASDDSVPFLNSALQSESWFASNKYILGALLIVAIVIVAIILLR